MGKRGHLCSLAKSSATRLLVSLVQGVEARTLVGKMLGSKSMSNPPRRQGPEKMERTDYLIDNQVCLRGKVERNPKWTFKSARP